MQPDNFEHLAKHYDSMMNHVDYERWVVVSTMIAELCPNEDFQHLDVGCGTGALVKLLRDHGWRSYGADLSPAMLAQARQDSVQQPLIRADMTNLPFNNSFHFMTCVFDSFNFLLDERDLQQSFLSIRDAMTPQGVLYFDVITEHMVTEHYADKSWVDRNGRSKMRWKGSYNQESRIVENTIIIDNANPTIVRERMYSIDEIQTAAQNAGLTILGILDTENWHDPKQETLRLDIVASVRDDAEIHNQFSRIREEIESILSDTD